MRLGAISILLVAIGFAQYTPPPSSGATPVAHNARQFSGTAQYAQSAGAINLSSTHTISVAFWMWWNIFANDDHLAMEQSADFNGQAGAFIINPNDSSAQKFSFGARSSGYLTCTFTRPSAAAWHHYVLEYDMSTATGACAAYVDGVDASATKTANPGASQAFANATLNVFSRNGGTSLLGAGKITEIAIWSSLLSASNAALLAAFTAPSSVDAANLLDYWPITCACGSVVEVVTTGSFNLTITGATAVSGPN